MNRCEDIDVLRGIAILFIVIGHFFNGYPFVDYIYIFHVPMFFFISGLCLNLNMSWRSYFLKKFKSIVIPYIFFGIIIIPSTFIFMTDLSLYSLLTVVIKYVIQQRYTTMWFLSALYVSEILFYLIVKFSYKYRNQEKANLIVVGFISAFTIIMSIYEAKVNVAWPWNADIGILCISFLSTGYLFKKCFYSKIKKVNATYKFIIAISMCVLGMSMGIISLISSTQRFDLFYGAIGIPYLSITSAILVSIGGLLLCQFCSWSRLLQLIGRHTMCIYALHQMLFKQIFFQIFKVSSIPIIFVSMILSIFLCLIIDVYITNSEYRWIIGR